MKGEERNDLSTVGEKKKKGFFFFHVKQVGKETSEEKEKEEEKELWSLDYEKELSIGWGAFLTLSGTSLNFWCLNRNLCSWS